MNEALDAIDEYLLELRDAVRYRQHSERLVADAEEHLRDAQSDLIAQGMGAADAAREATRRFGTTRVVSASSPRDGGALGVQCCRAALRPIATACVGIGVAGLLATSLSTIVGTQRVAAVSCLQIAVGFVGLSLFESRRRRTASGTDAATPGIPPTAVQWAAAAAFALLAASLLTAASIISLTGDTRGSVNLWLAGIGLALASARELLAGSRVRSAARLGGAASASL